MAEIHQLTLNYIQFQTWLLHLPKAGFIHLISGSKDTTKCK